MVTAGDSAGTGRLSRALARIAPGLPMLVSYRRADRGLPETEQGIRHFPTLRKAVGAYRAMLAAGNSSAAFAGGSQSSATPGPADSPGAGSATS